LYVSMEMDTSQSLRPVIKDAEGVGREARDQHCQTPGENEMAA